MCNEEAGDISESMLEAHNILLMHQEDVGDTDFSATENPAIIGALFPNYCVCTGEPVGAQQRDACSSMTTLFFWRWRGQEQIRGSVG